MGLRKTNSLKFAFWKFLIMLLAGLFCAAIIPFCLFILSTTFGFTTSANYSELSVKEITPIIASTDDLSKIQLPTGCNYLILDKKLQVIDTNLDSDDLKLAINYASTGAVNTDYNKQFTLITRDNEYVVLQYYINSTYTNPWLSKHFISPELLLCIIIIINCILVCIYLTTSFAKKLSLQLNPLFEATTQFTNKDLDFEIGHSSISEFEEVLIAFDEMKISLNKSLKKQWLSQQVLKEQIGALAHDLKTPLTVIMGNVDLISDTNMNDEQKSYAKYILDSSLQMKTYLKILIDITSTSSGYKLALKNTNTQNFIKQIQSQIAALCNIKHLLLDFNFTNMPLNIYCDEILLQRSIMNIISNAVDNSCNKDYIHVCFCTSDNDLLITITDHGKGFSYDDLNYGKQQFYMANSSRDNKMHYGMGLYIADCIVQQHNGQLILENSLISKGAKVTIKIPLKTLC